MFKRVCIIWAIAEDQAPKWPEDEALDISACYAALGGNDMEATVAPLGTKIAHTIRYIGSVDMGDRSEKSHINEAIESAINSNPTASHYMPVRMKLGTQFNSLNVSTVASYYNSHFSPLIWLLR